MSVPPEAIKYIEEIFAAKKSRLRLWGYCERRRDKGWAHPQELSRIALLLIRTNDTESDYAPPRVEARGGQTRASREGVVSSPFRVSWPDDNCTAISTLSDLSAKAWYFFQFKYCWTSIFMRGLVDKYHAIGPKYLVLRAVEGLQWEES